MSRNWSTATFLKKEKMMSLYEFTLSMEFNGFSTINAERFYEIYKDDFQAKKSE
jgi:hypothetical protein